MPINEFVLFGGVLIGVWFGGFVLFVCFVFLVLFCGFLCVCVWVGFLLLLLFFHFVFKLTSLKKNKPKNPFIKLLDLRKESELMVQASTRFSHSFIF